MRGDKLLSRVSFRDTRSDLEKKSGLQRQERSAQPKNSPLMRDFEETKGAVMQRFREDSVEGRYG